MGKHSSKWQARWREQEAESTSLNTSTKEKKQTGSGLRLLISEPTRSGMLPAARLCLLNLSKQRHQVGSERSNTRAFGGHSHSSSSHYLVAMEMGDSCSQCSCKDKTEKRSELVLSQMSPFYSVQHPGPCDGVGRVFISSLKPLLKCPHRHTRSVSPR